MKIKYLLILVFVALFTIDLWARPTLDDDNYKSRRKRTLEQDSSGSIPIWGNHGFGSSDYRSQDQFLNESQLMNRKSAENSDSGLPIYIMAKNNGANIDYRFDQKGSGLTNCPNIDLSNSLPDSSNCAPAYVPAPGALLLGCGGMLIVSWLRRRLR